MQTERFDWRGQAGEAVTTHAPRIAYSAQNDCIFARGVHPVRIIPSKIYVEERKITASL